MKKFLSGILFLLISVFIFADSSASIEGVIEVAGKDELPAGYFGKAAGYLPGDSVSITNPNTGITLQILNLGTLDASGGIAILISEESAKSLGIERNSGVKVKLAPRSGYFDETVSGNAVLDEKTLPAEKEETEETPSAPAVQAEPEVANQPAETAAVAAEVTPVAAAGVPLIADTEDNGEEENAEVAAVEDELPTDESESAPEETDSEVEAEQSEEIGSENEDDFSDVEKLSVEPVEEESAADEEPSVEPVEEETEPVVVEAPAPIEECEVPQDDEEPSAENVLEEPYEDYESIEDGFLESKEAVEQPSPAEESEEEAVTVEEPSPIEEEAEDLPEEEDVEPVIVEEPQPEEEAEAPAEDEIEEEAITVEEPSPIEDDSAAEEKQAEEVSEPEEVVEETAAEPEAQAEPEIQSSDEDESSDYAPIILVPSEPESPEPSATASAEDEPIEIVPVESVPSEKESEPEPLHSEYPVNIQNHVVSSESALASNCYYVQIATMGNIKNIENLLVKYSKYPISLIPAGKNYRVLVGPLSVDEYGAVLAKFKDAGFKDAFVRKR